MKLAFAAILFALPPFGQIINPPSSGGGGGTTTCATTSNLLSGNGTAGGCVDSGVAPQIINTSIGAAAIQLPHWRTVLGKVRTNAGNAKVLMIGDSTTWGHGSSLQATFVTTNSYPSRLGTLMAIGGVTPTSSGYGNPYVTGGSDADNRWSIGTGWFSAGFGNGSFEGTGAGNLIFTPSVNADTYQVFYLGNGGLGTVTMTATGGTPVVVNTGSLSAGVFSSTITAAVASTANNVTITQSGASYILGILPTLSTQSQVLLLNAGAAGAQTSAFIGTGNFSVTNYFKAIAPDLCIISLGINDAAASVASATVTANLQTIINYCKISGDVILETMPPSSGTPQSTFEALYVPAYYTLANSNSVPIIDPYTRFGSAYYAPMMFDGLHPNDYGYWDWAQQVVHVLTQ